MLFLRTCSLRYLLCSGFLIAPCSPGRAQDVSEARIEIEKVTDNLYVLTDPGNGNVGVCVGEDTVLLIDTKSAELTEKMMEAISELSDKPVRFVLNTHWHPDHTGGNENLADSGALIIAHENVLKRVSTEQNMEFFDTKVPPAPDKALPVITFSRDITFHLNGDKLYMFHVRNGHSDGDAIIYFHKANVIHMGDLYFEGLYPYIGVSSGGSVDGMIEVIKHVLSMIDDETIVIGGHGPLSTKSGLRDFVDMLADLRDDISRQIRGGKTLEEILESRPSRKYDAVWGQGFLSPDQFVRLLVMDLSRSR